MVEWVESCVLVIISGILCLCSVVIRLGYSLVFIINISLGLILFRKWLSVLGRLYGR